MKDSSSWLRLGFFMCVRVLIQIVLGRDVRGREHLPLTGPAILVANHNSHLDTVVLATLFPNRLLRAVRPVAAVDYFLRSRVLAWFVREVIGVIPLERHSLNTRIDMLQPCREALKRGEILILFPEGTRGIPEQPSKMKNGVAHLAESFPDIPIIPVLLHGLGKTLPKGHRIPVPFTCIVHIDKPLYFFDTRDAFMDLLAERFCSMISTAHFPAWK